MLAWGATQRFGRILSESQPVFQHATQISGRLVCSAGLYGHGFTRSKTVAMPVGPRHLLGARLATPVRFGSVKWLRMSEAQALRWATVKERGMVRYINALYRRSNVD